jgi:hypothetical protein
MLLRDFDVYEVYREEGLTHAIQRVTYKPTGDHTDVVTSKRNKRDVVKASEFWRDLMACEYAVMRETLRHIARSGCVCHVAVTLKGGCPGCAAQDALEELELL